MNRNIERVRLAGRLGNIQIQIALLQEELRIKDARMANMGLPSFLGPQTNIGGAIGLQQVTIRVTIGPSRHKKRTYDIVVSP